MSSSIGNGSTTSGSIMLEMVIYVPMRIVPYKQVEKLITMEEDFLIIVNLMQETIILLHLN